MRIGFPIIWAFILLLVGMTPATALDPKTHVTQYFHTAWRVQDGVFEALPNAVAQTADGYIWIGTGSGLVKYDGATFDPWLPPPGKLPNPNVTSLLGASDGALWIGTAGGLLSWKNNELREHLHGHIDQIIEDHKGRVWVARSRTPEPGPLCQVTGEHPGCFGGDDQTKLRMAVTLAEDVRGDIWAGGSGLVRWRDGSLEFYLREEFARKTLPTAVESVAAAPDGSVWVSVPADNSLGLLKMVDGQPHRVALEGMKNEHLNNLFVDREGSLWLATIGDGVYRVSSGQVDRFRSEDGLSSNSVGGFFEDREGNLWVTTSKGLDFFREKRVLTFSASEGLSADDPAPVLASKDGTVWAGNNGSLDAIHDGKVTSIPIHGRHVTALWQDQGGRLWVGIDNILTIYEHGQFHHVNRPDGSPLGPITSMGEDREGNLWAVNNPNHRLCRIRDMRVQEEFSSPKIPYPRLVAGDPSGGVWLGFLGSFGRYRDGKFEILGKNNPMSLSPEADGSLWVPTRAEGLVRWKDGRIQSLTSKNGLKCDSIYSVIRDDRRTLWLYAACGLIGIADSEIERWWRDPASVIQSTVLDALDGAMPGSSIFHPGVSKSLDGRLWFAPEGLLQVFDPNRSSGNHPAPPVYIPRVRADRKEYATAAAVRIPPSPREIEIDYTALSYSIPQRVRFRYKLEPLDREWHDAGTRRQAFYSDLPPKSYRFRVIASNSDGIWNQTGGTLEFSVAPAFYQTIWFWASGIAAFFLMLWGLYRLRLYQIAREFNAQLDGRVDERLRVARELHDTLLQTFQALLIHLQAAKNLFTQDPDDAMSVLDTALDLGGKAISEGRDTIQNMRSSTEVTNDLARALQAVGEELKSAGLAEFRVMVEGASRDLHPILRDDVYGIAREAIRNAFQHAEAHAIEVEIAYRENLRLRIRDDGKGVDPAIAKEGRPGHYGIPGMRERAARIGGKLTVWSAACAGTEIELSIPGSKAYGASAASSLMSRFRRGKDESKPTAAGHGG